MKRRAVLIALLAFPLPACAQSSPKIRRIGWLTGGSPKSHAQALAAFREGLREHGLGGGAQYHTREQPKNFELILHAGRAKAIGLTIPTAMLIRADRVIE